MVGQIVTQGRGSCQLGFWQGSHGSHGLSSIPCRPHMSPGMRWGPFLPKRGPSTVVPTYLYAQEEWSSRR